MNLPRFAFILPALAFCVIICSSVSTDAQEAAKGSDSGVRKSKTKKPTAKNDDVKKTSGVTKWTRLFDGKSLANWEIAKTGGEGEVVVEDGQIVMEPGNPITGITYTGKPPRTNYEIELDAMLLEGNDFFVGLTMPVADSYISFIVGGWAGAVVGLSNIDDKDASENDTTKFMKFEENKWYKIRVRVEPEQIRCWINEKTVVNQDIKGKKIGIRPEVDLSTPLGLSAFQTKVAYKSIRIRELKSEKKSVGKLNRNVPKVVSPPCR